MMRLTLFFGRGKGAGEKPRYVESAAVVTRLFSGMLFAFWTSGLLLQGRKPRKVYTFLSQRSLNSPGDVPLFSPIAIGGGAESASLQGCRLESRA